MEKESKVLAYNDFAFVSQSRFDCDLQVGFGNIALQMDLSTFFQFCKQVQHTFVQVMPACTCCRNIIVSTSVHKMLFMFTLGELEQLNDILIQSRILVEIKGLLKK